MTSRTFETDAGTTTVRGAREADLAGLADLVNAAYAKTEGHVFSGKRTHRTALADDRERLVVAERDGRVVGCVHVDVSGEPAHFGLLAVDVALHGEGIGSLLIAEAERLAHEAGRRRMRIESVKEAGLVPYYERRGYRVVAEHVGQEWNGGQDWGALLDWHMVELEKEL